MLIEHPDQMIVQPLDADSVSDIIVVDDVSMMRIHGSQDCIPPCPFHSPSDHHMVTWPLEVGGRTEWVAYRTCVHGTQHLDPDNHPPTLHRAGTADHDAPCEEWRGCCSQMCCHPIRIEVNGHSYYW